MIEDAPRIGCNRCKVPLGGVLRGFSDTYDNVMLELGRRSADALSRAFC